VCDPGDDAADGSFDPLRGNVRRGRLRECGCGASDDFAESGEAGVLVVRLEEGRFEGIRVRRLTLGSGQQGQPWLPQ
jgi:hypothetical protein